MPPTTGSCVNGATVASYSPAHCCHQLYFQRSGSQSMIYGLYQKSKKHDLSSACMYQDGMCMDDNPQTFTLNPNSQTLEPQYTPCERVDAWIVCWNAWNATYVSKREVGKTHVRADELFRPLPSYAGKMTTDLDRGYAHAYTFYTS